jgi:hypothetical protein
MNYIWKNHLKVSEESQSLGHSFRSLNRQTLLSIQERYPHDFEIIKKWFLLCEAGMFDRGGTPIED